MIRSSADCDQPTKQPSRGYSFLLLGDGLNQKCRVDAQLQIKRDLRPLRRTVARLRTASGAMSTYAGKVVEADLNDRLATVESVIRVRTKV